jgi:hypothetical protein
MGSPVREGTDTQVRPYTRQKPIELYIALALRLLAVLAGQLIKKTFAIEIGEQ